MESKSNAKETSGWLRWGPCLIGCAAGLIILLALDPGGDHPGGWDGPGLTIDEPLNVGQSVRLVDHLFSLDFAGYRQADSAMHDYPPLGRVAIGVVHELALVVWPPQNPGVPFSIACARVASGLVFAITVWLVGRTAREFWGEIAGVTASAALALFPRSFGHAHLASLETVLSLVYLGVVVFATRRILWLKPAVGTKPIVRDFASESLPPSETLANATSVNERRPRLSGYCASAAGTGVILGCALLIKIQAIFLIAGLLVWGLLWLRWRGIAWLAIVYLAAALVFVGGWTWLWDDPPTRVIEYFGKTTDRISINAWYQGRSWSDKELPWHYPWVMFFTAIPIGFLVAGGIATWNVIRSFWSTPRESLIAAGMLVPLVVFSIPGVAVYDGERLFSMVFPLWALLAGRGFQDVWNWLFQSHEMSSRRRLVAVCFSLFIVCQGVGIWKTSPTWLSYYNILVGGTYGANSIGLPASYWGDGLTRRFLIEAASRIPPNTVVAVAPTLYPHQADELLRQTPSLRAQGIQLASYGTPQATEATFVLLFNRPEYLPEEYRLLVPSSFVVVEERAGVWLAGLIETKPQRPPTDR